MNSYQISVFAGFGVLCLAVSSCGDLNQPLEGGSTFMDPGMTASGLGSMTPTGVSTDIAPKFHQMHVAAATAEQRRTAELRASNALKSSTVSNEVKKKKVQYVAVPVKRSKTQTKSGTPLMKVNVATGVSTGEVFVAESEGPKDGESFKLGGDATLYLALTGDKL